MIKRLVFYDMDGTLIDTPTPVDGKERWKEVTGDKYPHQGWWGRAESLDIEVFKIKPFPKVLSKLKDDTTRRDTHTVLLTNRIEKLKTHILKILKSHDIKLDDYSLRRNGENKDVRIKKFLKKFPDVEEIVVYDDRKKELDILSKLKTEIGDDVTVDIYKVDKGKISLLESYNKIKHLIEGVVVEFGKENKNNRIYNKI